MDMHELMIKLQNVEQLPCRLRYSDWREIDIGTYENDVSKQVNTEDTTTICLTDSESANSMAIRWRKLPDHQQSNSRITRVDREKFPDLLLGKWKNNWFQFFVRNLNITSKLVQRIPIISTVINFFMTKKHAYISTYMVIIIVVNKWS